MRLKDNLEPGPEQQVDAVHVVIQTRETPARHDELMVVVDADHQ